MSPRKQALSDAERTQQILAAAAQVFAAKGFHKTTTKDIAKAAGIAEGTIYNYFASKRDLLRGLLQLAGSMETLATVQTTSDHDAKEYYAADARERFRAIYETLPIWRAIFPEILVDPDLRALFRTWAQEKYAVYVEAYLRERIAAGELAPLEDVVLTARVMQAIPLGLLVQLLLDDPLVTTEWDKLPEIIAHLLYDGLKP